MEAQRLRASKVATLLTDFSLFKNIFVTSTKGSSFLVGLVSRVNLRLLFLNVILRLTVLKVYIVMDWCRFNGEDFLRRVRGQKIMFVGDSLSLNQWQSMTCLLHSAVPMASTSSVKKGDLSSLTFVVSLYSAFVSLTIKIPYAATCI